MSFISDFCFTVHFYFQISLQLAFIVTLVAGEALTVGVGAPRGLFEFMSDFWKF